MVAVLTLSDESASSRASVAKVVEQSSDDLAPISSSANPAPATITVIRHIHHLIDPTTGRSCASGVASVTVLADSCANAEVLAKQFVLLGGDSAEANAGRLGVDALFVGYDGGVHRIGQWERVGP